jgi:hypothetical protein
MKDLDLVIKKPKIMMKFVSYLCHTMETLDGNKGTARPLKDRILYEKLE